MGAPQPPVREADLGSRVQMACGSRSWMSSVGTPTVAKSQSYAPPCQAVAQGSPWYTPPLVGMGSQVVAVPTAPAASALATPSTCGSTASMVQSGSPCASCTNPLAQDPPKILFTSQWKASQ